VSGVVPENEQSFFFTIYCEDDDELVDTLSVEVIVSSYTLLRGGISGVLSIGDSPFRIPETSWVESGDSLIIEPGCLIYTGQPYWLPRPNVELSIYGYLECVGTADDSIYFLGYGEHDGKMPKFFTSNDTSEIAYTQCFGGVIGGRIISYGTNLRVHNCRFLPTKLNKVSSSDSSWTEVYDNVFQDICSFIIYGGFSQLEIHDNIIRNDSSFINLRSIYGSRFRNCSVNSNNNIFRNCGGAYRAIEGGTLVSKNDIFLECTTGFVLDNDETLIENCFLSATPLYPSFRTYSSNVTIINSIVLNDTTGLIGEIEEDGFVNIRNCAFLTSDAFTREIIEEFGILSEVNINGDSTDSYGNLFGDPILLDFYPYEYRLRHNSPCIDAAFCENHEENPDGTPPDIGPVPYNHNNNSIEITDSHIFPRFWKRVDEEIRCSVDIVDEDEDSIAFQWDLYQLSESAQGLLLRTFSQTIGRNRDVVFTVGELGTYQVRCMATDGYIIDSYLFDAFFVFPSDVSEDKNIISEEFKFHQNYPNPFNSSTSFLFELQFHSNVKLEVFNLLGRKLARLTDKPYAAGSYQILWRPENLPSGKYLCRIVTSGKSEVISITLLK